MTVKSNDVIIREYEDYRKRIEGIKDENPITFELDHALKAAEEIGAGAASLSQTRW